MTYDKPKVLPYLDWVRLERWFTQEYPEQFKATAVSEWVSQGWNTPNGSLVIASEEGIWDGIKNREEALFFVRKLEEHFPEAMDEYGYFRIYFWW